MIDLTHHAKLKQLARNLHIPDSGDCLRELRDHAIASVQQMLKEWSVETIGELRSLVADKLSVKIEYISEDQDTERLAEKYGQVMGGFRHLLRAEFIKSDTEGLLIDNPKPGKGGRDYLVIVDARGSRKMRAYFTAWHELSHLLLYPRRQAVFEGFRRTPTLEAKLKDPVESAVDHIAGLLAFWEPLFKPALLNATSGNLSLEAIERACAEVAPGASLQSACLSAVRIWEEPTAFVTAAVSRKSDGTSPSLRVQSIVANDAARAIGCKVRKQMRVPPASAISKAFGDIFATRYCGMENQADWQVSGQGSLSALDWQVDAARRGPLVYSLLTNMALRPAFSGIKRPNPKVLIVSSHGSRTH
jgi:hypothetical protein